MHAKLVLPSTALFLATLVAAGRPPAQVQLSPLPPQGFPEGIELFGAATADYDGDGDLDLLEPDPLGTPELWLNDGEGHFSLAPFQVFPDRFMSIDDIAAGDADGDGDIDALVLEVNDRARMFVNDGRGAFTEDNTRLPAARIGWYWTAAFVDVDRDRDLDIVLSSKLTPHVLLINDGTGVFADETAARMPAVMSNAQALATGDVDGDGSIDFYFAAFDQDLLFINDGSGVFRDETAARLPYRPATNSDVHLADVTGDGAPDLMLGNRDAFGGWMSMFVNDGQGRFEDATSMVPFILSDVSSIDSGDIDEDGDADVLVGGYNDPTHLLLNGGGGVFSRGTARIAQITAQTWAIRLADLDGDGDLDLLQANRSILGPRTGSAVFFNLHRHLDTPLQARLGAPFDLVLYAEPGYATAPRSAVPLLATHSAAIPLPPLGTLRLDPARMIALPAVGISPITGQATVRLQIPSAAHLRGVAVFAQGLVVETPAEARLTNRTRDVIR